MTTEPTHRRILCDVSLLGRLLENVLKDQGREQFESNIRGILLDVEVAASIPQQERSRAVTFIVRRIPEAEWEACQRSPSAREALARKIAFLWFSLWPTEDTLTLLWKIAHSAYWRTAGVLAPFIDEEDCFELFRWHVWNMDASYFSFGKAVLSKRMRAFLGHTARNLARDHLRRLARNQFNSVARIDYQEAFERPSTIDATKLLVYRELVDIVLNETSELPPYLQDLSIKALVNAQPREKILKKINKERSATGQQIWSAGTFRQFLHRLRTRLIERLRKDGLCEG